MIPCKLQFVTCKNQLLTSWIFILLQYAKMSTRKTTTGYKVTIDFDQRQEKFDFYEDVKVCFKPVLRGYDLDNITSDFKLDELEIDFLLGKISKKELKEERYWHGDEYFKELDGYKKNYEVVGLSIGEHSQFSIWYGDDWVMLVDKDASVEFIDELVKELTAWMNGRIYSVNVYAPITFKSEEFVPRKLTYWEWVDGQGGYFDFEEALNSLPEYAGKIIKETETERFEDIER